MKFAPLIRVSTEKQARQGESLATQRKQLEQAIKNLNGTIYKWYAGQEHATPDYERKILDELMSDAQQNKFDAIMVVDISRWSRDNQRSKTDLAILKEKNIEFYVLERHMDLNIPFNNLMIGMGTEINEYFANEQAYKSITNKIQRALGGCPSSGQSPYGRKYNKETKAWEIDKEKQQCLEDAANRYLKGESMQSIADFYNMNLPNLHKLLKKTSGDTWDIHFKSRRFKIDEMVTLKVPRLLSQDIIDKIKKRSDSNKTFTHGQAKHQYLLAKMIFCEECGMAFFGQEGKYYRHSKTDRCKKPITYLQDSLIEANVLSDIIEMFGDKPAIARAAKAAIPDIKESKELQLTINQAEKELAKIKRAKDNLLSQVEQGNLMGDDLKNRMAEHKESEKSLLSKRDSCRRKLQSIPTKEDISRKSQLLLRLKESIYSSQKHLEKMTWIEKWNLLQAVFDGKDADGKRLGVYIGKNKKGDCIYTIKGIMGFTLTDYVRKLHLEPPCTEDYLIEDDHIIDDKLDLRCIYAAHHRRDYHQ